MDITYFESGYILDDYFTYTAEGTSLLAFNSQLSITPTVSVKINANLPVVSTMVTNGGKIITYVGYTIFEPVGPKQPFSTQFFAPEVV